MPSMWGGYFVRARTCAKKFSWSTMRGGCRFTPGHKGDCRPASRRNRYA